MQPLVLDGSEARPVLGLEQRVAEPDVRRAHVGRILTKLALRDRVQAVVLAYESGLVTGGRG